VTKHSRNCPKCGNIVVKHDDFLIPELGNIPVYVCVNTKCGLGKLGLIVQSKRKDWGPLVQIYVTDDVEHLRKASVKELNTLVVEQLQDRGEGFEGVKKVLEAEPLLKSLVDSCPVNPEIIYHCAECHKHSEKCDIDKEEGDRKCIFCGSYFLDRFFIESAYDEFLKFTTEYEQYQKLHTKK